MYSTCTLSVSRGEGVFLRPTYIRVATNLLDDRLVEVPRVPKEAACDAVGMLQTIESIADKGELGAFAELMLLVFRRGMNVLHPAVVHGGSGMRHVVFEDDHV